MKRKNEQEKRQSERVQVTEFSFRQQNKLNIYEELKDNHWAKEKELQKKPHNL